MAKEKFYSLYGKAVDKNGQEHYVTVVGKMTQTKETETTPVDIRLFEDGTARQLEGVVFEKKKVKTRTFEMAWAICDPRDKFDFNVGIELAKKRIERGQTIGTQTTHDVTMLNDDQCNMLVFVEVNHIVKNIDSYIN